MFKSLFPIVRKDISKKKALACSDCGGNPLYYKKLGLPLGYYWYQWSPYHQAGTEYGNRLPMLWGQKQLSYFKKAISQDYDGYLLFLNEPDRPDQANLTPGQCVDLYFEVMNHAPNIKLIGLNVSNAEYHGGYTLEFWRQFLDRGGNPDNFVAFAFHIYEDNSQLSPRQKVDRFYDTFMKPTNQEHKKVWVTEVGYRSCLPNAKTIYKQWLKELDIDPRVAYWFGFTTNDPNDCGYGFIAKNGNLTNLGKAFKSIT